MIDIAALLSLLAEPGQPAPVFRAIDSNVQALIGHRLFTLLHVDGEEVARIYSNRPAEYPLAGRKMMGPTPWGDLVMKRRQPYLGPDKAAIRWAFPDHALIETMGLGATINLPVIYDGAAIGVVNILDAEYSYTPEHLAKVLPLAPLLVPAFLQARRAAG